MASAGRHADSERRHMPSGTRFTASPPFGNAPGALRRSETASFLFISELHRKM